MCTVRVLNIHEHSQIRMSMHTECLWLFSNVCSPSQEMSAISTSIRGYPWIRLLDARGYSRNSARNIFNIQYWRISTSNHGYPWVHRESACGHLRTFLMNSLNIHGGSGIYMNINGYPWEHADSPRIFADACGRSQSTFLYPQHPWIFMGRISMDSHGWIFVAGHGYQWISARSARGYSRTLSSISATAIKIHGWKPTNICGWTSMNIHG